eukprot:jgi/Chrzof1/6413/Cz18g09230.t1_LCKAS7
MTMNDHPMLRPVYLLDFAVYKPPEEFKMRDQDAVQDSALYRNPGWAEIFEGDKAVNVDFYRQVYVRSGLADYNTYMPPKVHPCLSHGPQTDMTSAMEEAKMVLFGVVQQLLDQTGGVQSYTLGAAGSGDHWLLYFRLCSCLYFCSLAQLYMPDLLWCCSNTRSITSSMNHHVPPTGLQPKDIDILVTSCSIFCPTPSMSALLVNKFKFREDIQSYHLGGMGCGSGAFAMCLIRDLLQAHPNATALLVPAEIVTYCFYKGAHRKHMIANIIFRMGGACACVTNKPALKRKAKYQLQHAIRVHAGQNDASYGCMAWQYVPDEKLYGVYLAKDVPQQAGVVLTKAFRAIAPKIMTWTQYGEAAYNMFQSQVLGNKDVKPYVPDFTKCVDHFALHAGGHPVLIALRQSLNLPVEAMLPSFSTLRDYGNTSCSTTWYSMAYMESMGVVKAGHRIMQVGVGGGMKAGINIWRALRDTSYTHPAWAHLNGTPYSPSDMPRPIDVVPDDLHTLKHAGVNGGNKMNGVNDMEGVDGVKPMPKAQGVEPEELSKNHMTKPQAPKSVGLTGMNGVTTTNGVNGYHLTAVASRSSSKKAEFVNGVHVNGINKH